MATLKNRFRWSFTRQRCFDECKRLYYYRYYGMWNGWNHDASEEAKKCYTLSKMTNLPMLAGRIVHDVIEGLLKDTRHGRPIPALNELQERAVGKLRLAWVQSRDKEWLGDPKRKTNLFEHHYGRDIAKADTDAVKERVLGSLANLYNSDTFARIRRIKALDWKSVEELLHLQIDGFEILLKIDFAADFQGVLEIYDWKTGREDESGIEQLACYALYAEQEWGYSVDTIALKLFYLAIEDVPRESEIRPEQMTRTRAMITDNCRMMQSLLADPENNVADKDIFPMTSDRDTCMRCFFQELCHGGSLID
ncbi:MAG: PD-(D/E)XK nuclease family protein [Chloroflexi bacterium]|nr:PD-(D/E)XK nuclease family protein [Chloroflexota bacterium]